MSEAATTSGVTAAPAILFVDDEPNVLSGLRRMLRPRSREWRMAFATSGDEALSLMDGAGFDAIVTDMRMPRMDGAELLCEVEKRHPDTVRIVLSGQCDQEGALRSVGPSHLFLSKPCEADALVKVVERALSLRKLILAEPVRRAVAGLRAIPTLPDSYHAITRAMDRPNASAHDVASAVERDPAVSAVLLHVANSAYFAPKRQVTSITQAVQYLGLDIVRAVVLSSGVIDQFSTQLASADIIRVVWEHSLRVAGAARAAAPVAAALTAAREGREMEPGADKRLEAEAYSAGLLHDVGILALAAAFPDEHADAAGAAESERDLAVEEMRVLGVDHAAVGGYLMGLWGLPERIVEAITYHHRVPLCYDPSAPILRAVAVGCAVDHMAAAGWTLEEAAHACLDDRTILTVKDTPVIKAAWEALTR